MTGIGRIEERPGVGLVGHGTGFNTELRSVERWRWNDHAHAVLLRFGESDVKVGTEHVGHFTLKELPNGLTGNPTNNFTDEVTLRDQVVPRSVARCPPGCLGRQLGRREFPVGQLFGGQFIPGRESGGVGHQVPYLYGLFAVGTKLGPVLRDGGEEVQFATVHQHQGHEERHRLGRRPDVHDGVALPRRGLGLVLVAAPDVNDEFVVVHHGDGGANVGTAVELTRKHGPNGLELLSSESLYFSHEAPSIQFS